MELIYFSQLFSEKSSLTSVFNQFLQPLYCYCVNRIKWTVCFVKSLQLKICHKFRRCLLYETSISGFDSAKPRGANIKQPLNQKSLEFVSLPPPILQSNRSYHRLIFIANQTVYHLMLLPAVTYAPTTQVVVLNSLEYPLSVSRLFLNCI